MIMQLGMLKMVPLTLLQLCFNEHLKPCQVMHLLSIWWSFILEKILLARSIANFVVESFCSICSVFLGLLVHQGLSKAR
jgi:hypothetical protein